MSPRLADVPTRVDAPASPKHPFNREPLLVPQLFVDTRPRWYQRRAVVVTLAISVVITLAAALAIRLYTVDALAKKFSSLVSR